ncbi:hypothetical protein PHLCEN_2v7340 [Hermanssonia centrifuga]|uniref:ATP-dependent RNA helicase n=1 Tax=Hermanssonia centrifuga TaxID=98765 RepID=A0A2R6NWX4_9APHY|nr:hypothetical protein PHLCEN_2v7340 [Hermanssonia centrifuga]
MKTEKGNTEDLNERGTACETLEVATMKVASMARLPTVRWASFAAQPQSEQSEGPTFTPKGPETADIGEDQPTFSSLRDKINPAVLKAITVKPFNFTTMSVVQAAVLPMLPGLAVPYNAKEPSSGRQDLLVKAKTGTGKTLAFIVPAIEARLKAIDAYGKQAVIDAGLGSDPQLEARARDVYARTHAGCLIISPTRELATQIANEAIRLSHHIKGFETRLFVGGESKRMQMRDWMHGSRDIVVATPGRIRDVLESEPEVTKGLEKTPMLILDEADTLLEMGFREEISAIADFLPQKPERQTFMFSATVSREIQQVAREILNKNHLFVNCVSEDSSPVHAHVPQYHTVLPSAGHQIPHLLRILAHDQLINPQKSKSIIFLPTTKMTQLFSTLLRELSKTMLPAGRQTHVYEIHSKRTQASRTRMSDTFRADTSRASILVSSDVSARGVDYPGVTRIIQVGIPSRAEQYVHRVGRTGRGDKSYGRADLILLPWEIGFVTWQLTNIPLKPLTVNELSTQVKALAEKFDETSQPATPYAPVLDKFDHHIASLLDQLDGDAIRETMMSMLGYYIPHSDQLRVQKEVMLAGLKEWAVHACGLPTPPHISATFLEKLGISDSRKRNRSSFDFNRNKGRGDNSHWQGGSRAPFYKAKNEGSQRSFGRSRENSWS